MTQPSSPHQALQWIASQRDAMRDLLVEWSLQNSGSYNLDGLEAMLQLVKKSYTGLYDEEEILSLPPQTAVHKSGKKEQRPLGRALRLKKRSQAKQQVFLCGHLDTVFAQDHPFQKVHNREDKVLHGPGVVDLKGGLVVMLYALKALESSPVAQNLGWEILLNPDEEIGSPGSAPLLLDAGKRHSIGLIVEPSYPDGTFVSERKGSGNFTLIIRGLSAHAGRDFFEGRNAIHALGEVITELQSWSDAQTGLTVNVGSIHGGGAVNVVPDLAMCHFNIRTPPEADPQAILVRLNQLVESVNEKEGFSCELAGALSRGPKPFDPGTQQLFKAVASCGETLGIDLKWRPSGGVCDGNIVAQGGCAVIDTLGVIGGKMHTEEEYMLIDSLIDRCQLMALFLMRLASGEIDLKKEATHG